LIEAFIIIACNFCFGTEIGQFEKTVDSLVEILSAQAEKIERQKLMV
jgi:hypothetical protein